VSLGHSILIAAAAVIVTYAFEYYLKRASVKLEMGRSYWSILSKHYDAVVSGDLPFEAKQAARAIMATTGCGCYVRQILISSYAPRAIMKSYFKHNTHGHPPRSSSLPSIEQQEVLRNFMFSAMMFDAFSNPLQGWLVKLHMQRIVARGAVQDDLIQVAERRARKLEYC